MLDVWRLPKLTISLWWIWSAWFILLVAKEHLFSFEFKYCLGIDVIRLLSFHCHPHKSFQLNHFCQVIVMVSPAKFQASSADHRTPCAFGHSGGAPRASCPHWIYSLNLGRLNDHDGDSSFRNRAFTNGSWVWCDNQLRICLTWNIVAFHRILPYASIQQQAPADGKQLWLKTIWPENLSRIRATMLWPLKLPCTRWSF